MYKQFNIVIVLFIALSLFLSGTVIAQSSTEAVKLNYQQSPCTLYTRAHWLKITEKIIDGALSHFNSETGLPDFAVSTSGPGYEEQH